jgi:hypothetical protein
MLTIGTIILMIPLIAALDTYDELRRRRFGLSERRQNIRKKARRSGRKPKR